MTSLGRVGWGAALLTMPKPLCRFLTGTVLEPRAALVVRALGARTLLQELLIGSRRSRRLVLIGAGVDGLHATSMAALALTGSRYSRPAAVSAAVSGAAAVSSLRSLLESSPPDCRRRGRSGGGAVRSLTRGEQPSRRG